MNKTTGNILIVLVLIQTLAIAWLVYDRMQSNRENLQLTENLQTVTDERDAVQTELQSMYEQYESLKTDNEEINAELEAQQERISDLMAQLKRTKRSNFSKIKELEAEAETLRSIMKDYIRQIDELNTKNKQLMAENKTVKQNYNKELKEKESIITERDSLTSTVKKAAQLKGYGIMITPLNKRGKSTTRARKMERIKVCFNIAENVIAKKGRKTIYIRIAGPDNQILLASNSKMFNYQGKEIAYSALKKITYKGEITEVCMFWQATREYPPGKYSVDIFADGSKIGSQNFVLK